MYRYWEPAVGGQERIEPRRPECDQRSATGHVTCFPSAAERSSGTRDSPVVAMVRQGVWRKQFELLHPRWRNSKKLGNNRLTSSEERTCVKARTGPMESSDGRLSRWPETPKSLPHKGLHTGVDAGRRRAGWRGAGNNAPTRLRHSRILWCKALQENNFLRCERLPPKGVVGPRRAETEKTSSSGNRVGGRPRRRRAASYCGRTAGVGSPGRGG